MVEVVQTWPVERMTLLEEVGRRTIEEEELDTLQHGEASGKDKEQESEKEEEEHDEEEHHEEENHDE